MMRRMWLSGLLLALAWATPAKADTRVIVRTTNLGALQTLCLLPATCSLSPTGALDGTLGQVFVVTTPLPVASFLPLLQGLTGFVDAEVDQVLSVVGLANLVPSPIPITLMSDRTLVAYPSNSGTMVWNSYATQPAASIVEVQNAQSNFSVTGAGIVADIDTGVDPNHPALQGVLLPGYDFTRNQSGGSELNDLSPSDFPTYPPPSCSSATCPSAVQVNQSSAAILDQSSAAILDTNNKYAAFGHGTMVMGVIHLVAPTAQLLPLKAFHSDGTANLSDILRAIYYAAQNNANVINMSFDTTTPSTELKDALDYASQLGVICVASAGNDGQQAPPNSVYPAALQSDVMGVASVGSTQATEGTRSSFSNYGDPIVWVAAPGEAIITTYPFGTYSAGWGTSFSAPFVSGGVALLRNLKTAINETQAAAAIANAAPLADTTLGHGRLDLVPALQSLAGAAGSPDYTVAAAPGNQTIAAGANASYTVSAAPSNDFKQTVTWSCTGAPAAATCSVSPSSVTLDGIDSATAAVTLTTTARAFAAPPSSPYSWRPRRRRMILTACYAWLVVLLMLYILSRGSRLRPGLTPAVGVLAFSLCAYSCGGGYTGGTGSGSPTLSSIMLSPSSVNGGATSTGTVTLSGAAPNGGAIVYLSSNATAATVPASVTVGAGATSATFTVSTNAVTASTPATVTASYAGGSKTAQLTVTPAPGGTPAGTYTLTVTGSSGNLSHSTTVQVTVN
jgi:hypothetical protein